MRILSEAGIMIVFALTAVFLYHTYGDDVRHAIFGDEQLQTIYIGSKSLDVAVADTPAERIQGLSGTPELKNFEGMLFIFDTDARHGIWMKDMLMPLDILWIDKNLKVVHIEKNVQPSSYPSTTFSPPVDARFVLEVNAHFASTVKVDVGDRLTLPPLLLPDDIKENLQ